MTNEELLKVLDMSEDEQHRWVDNNCELEGYRSIGSGFVPTESLADLAFRLRDEVESKVEFHHCFAKVCKHIDPHIMNYAGYVLCTAKPIHWIIAALIAKESK